MSMGVLSVIVAILRMSVRVLDVIMRVLRVGMRVLCVPMRRDHCRIQRYGFGSAGFFGCVKIGIGHVQAYEHTSGGERGPCPITQERSGVCVYNRYEYRAYRECLRAACVRV